jgi:hypothetical protein
LMCWSKLIIGIITWKRTYKTRLQHLMHQDMMRLGNIDSVLEQVNFFLPGKAWQLFIGDYVSARQSQKCTTRRCT